MRSPHLYPAPDAETAKWTTTEHKKELFEDHLGFIRSVKDTVIYEGRESESFVLCQL